MTDQSPPNEMTALELLQATKALLTREAWTKGELARDADNIAIDPLHPQAVCWCVEGALRRVAGVSGDALLFHNDPSALAQAWRAIIRVCGTHSPSITNDRQGFAAVHAVLDRAMLDQPMDRDEGTT